MSLLDDLANTTARHAHRDRPQHPQGWEPGIRFEGGSQVLYTPATDNPDWDTLLAEYLPPGFNHDEWTIDPESVRFTAWDGWQREAQGLAATSAKQYSFRARILHKPRRDTDVDELSTWIRKSKAKRPEARAIADALCVVWADWQVGKADGDGTRGTVERFMDSIGQTQDLIRDHKPDALYILPVGDLGEGCAGHYAQQTFTVELNERDQRKLVRRMAVKALKEYARHVPQIVVAPVGGNHGEVRAGGKSFTDFADNRDVAVFEDAAEIFAENDEAYGHISFSIPAADLTQTLNVAGTIVGLAHGHQFRGGGSVEQKATRWWRGQMDGRQPIGDADILVSGHFHHLRVSQQGARTWMQAPALDGVSDWFRDVSGMDSPAGTLTFTVGDAGWDNLRVI